MKALDDYIAQFAQAGNAASGKEKYASLSTPTTHSSCNGF